MTDNDGLAELAMGTSTVLMCNGCADDSEGPAEVDSMDQYLNGCAVLNESRSPPIIRTDKELIIAAKTLRWAFQSMSLLQFHELETQCVTVCRARCARDAH